MIKLAVAGVFIALLAMNSVADKLPSWYDIRVDCKNVIGTFDVLIPLGDKKQLRMSFTCEADA